MCVLVSYSRIQACAQIGHDPRHGTIGFLVRESASFLLKNQPQSNTFSTGFYTRSAIDIENEKLCQKLRGGQGYTFAKGA
jgi:hypothetical protein